MKLSSLSKVLVASLLLTSASLSFADRAPTYKEMAAYKGLAAMPCPTLKDGLYAGIQGGYDAYSLRNSFTAGGNFAATSSMPGWVGGVFLGFGRYLNDVFYLGAEVLGNFNGTSKTLASGNDNDGDAYNVNAKAQGTWGVSLLPGLKLNPGALGYLRLGYDWTKFEINSTAVDGGTTTYTANTNPTQGGYNLGVGVEALVYDNWSVRTEYNHVWYNTINFASSPGGASASSKPSDNQFMVGLLYHFG